MIAGFGLIGFILGGLALLVALAMAFRIVVPTNETHIVQAGAKTVSYGNAHDKNVYYAWPSWIPRIGVKVSRFPVSNFTVSLDNYKAYDKGRVPFLIDIVAFFRIDNSNTAAQRVASMQELHEQLEGVLQGAVRSILAKEPIEEILEKRAEYGLRFTEAVTEQLLQWGVVNVKQIELMDIRDGEGSKVIANIMAIKQSDIDRDSREKVAKNHQLAKVAEIEAERNVDLSKQEATQTVGIRTAEQVRVTGIADQVAQQEIKVAQRDTEQRQKDIEQVQQVRAAEILREAQVVAADQERQVTILKAEGDLEEQKRIAQAVEINGLAIGAADTAKLRAPVTTQLELAAGIASNERYQMYLIAVREIEKNEVVGVEQAKAITAADIKVIANSGGIVDGIANVSDLFSSKGGQQLGAMIEGFRNTPAGAAIVSAATNGRTEGAQA